MKFRQLLSLSLLLALLFPSLIYAAISATCKRASPYTVEVTLTLSDAAATGWDKTWVGNLYHGSRTLGTNLPVQLSSYTDLQHPKYILTYTIPVYSGSYRLDLKGNYYISSNTMRTGSTSCSFYY